MARAAPGAGSQGLSPPAHGAETAAWGVQTPHLRTALHYHNALTGQATALRAQRKSCSRLSDGEIEQTLALLPPQSTTLLLLLNLTKLKEPPKALS